MRNNNFFKFIFWVYVAIVAACVIFSMAGCNPVKRVLNNPKYYDKIAEHVISSGLCVNDSVYISDTTILLDTLNVIETNTDTVTVNDTVRITKTEYKNIVKTVTIRDTTIVTDNSRINILQKQLIENDRKLLETIEQREMWKGETKQARKDRNKWRLYFFILLAAFAGWLLRKPILKLIKPL